MYNGIGLVTPRGSGTNGYVQRNMSFVQKSREKVSYKTEEDIKKLDALVNRKPNQGILAHERKRTIELKCLEMQELMEDQGYPDDEIEAKVAMFRQMLVEKEGSGEKEVPKDEFGRPIVKESHQIAEANQEKNCKMREALGISQYFVEGSSLDPERKTKEAAAAAAAAAAEEAKKKYTLIPDSSSSSSPERSQDKEKDKKRKKKKSHSNREKVEESPKKKKSVKKHKKERSLSPDVQKKKKVKKPVKEKTKHKSKNEVPRKKHSARSSSSSSSSSSDSADDESSSRATSRDSQSDTSVERQKSSSKYEKSQKANRKRSTSSEKIRYSKDARSRKDIYEAKKDRHKRKSARSSSSSSGDSSPKQYFRLEPVLLKSKSKRKKAQIIEIPSTSAFELRKYDRKKRAHESSSSEGEGARPEGKRRKRSESPVVSKSSRHRSERDEPKTSSKVDDSYKSSRRSEKEPHSSIPEKHRRDRSRSTGSQQKYHPKVHTISDDESEHIPRRKPKDRPKEIVEDWHHEKGSRSRKKHGRRGEAAAESPTHHNGYHKHPAKPQETEDSDRSERSLSAHKRKKYVPRSPSHSPPYIPKSPVTYKNKKHIIKSPSYDLPTTHTKKTATKHHRSRQSVSKSPPPKRHDSTSSRSPSPTAVLTKRNGRDPKASARASKEVPRANRTPPRRREENQSASRSPSQHRSTKTKSKQKSKRAERSPSGSAVSDLSDDQYAEKRKRLKEWKSKGVAKEVKCKSRSNSPVHHKSNHGKPKKNRDPSEELSEMRILSPKNKKGMTIIVESCQISPSKESSNHNRDSVSTCPVPLQPSSESKRQKKDVERIVSKSSPVWSKDNSGSPGLEKSKRPVAKVYESEVYEMKIKRGSSEDATTTTASVTTSKEVTMEDAFTVRKNNWNLITNSDNRSPSISKSPLSKGPSVPRNEEPVAKEENRLSSQKESKKREPQAKDRKKASNHSPTRSRSASENPETEKGAKAKQRSRSRSRSRSTSVAHSRSGSERSSRSYSHRGTKSYSQSRSQSYSKSRSRSHSHSRSKTRSKSRSKSHSRSRSKSYSRSISIDSRSRSRSYSSRSRSRSNARSPSIPRRRGSPSFLDKRRITSARKRPVPYRRPSPSTPSSSSSWSPHRSRSSSPLPHLSSRSRSWSPVPRQKHEVALLHADALR